ncbi:MAG: family 2 glycosyl transferase [Candidatus Gottesmanbacteria bacterium GW2011_GWB1_43_11]|uniref:Family 2 glycosyl transferase n=1 Tax=Candidatus Gottesmanbacteria bacterium GW2011_GWB1_43_11 TaxID=1618446 RepID=A0A0G1EWN3_9BACT|nr:MAG: family 2 glycosyl transferase [Candidatus Gottesmanbacteria bacterium GW2011_GWA2_42_16]KKS56228.1 MAG: family 2 glycosyl transferase [Candidatus Gottesmanbacteria bacterium GW2011_GWA1_42_26]KKS82562.1 MAG: family 2 glycosyl transferase [Candidatus Gottesmanbacteria bacterium GW2011_GWC1_43_10]KKS87431.1 MAG: family 2 glycosyl transferase [Candidatus Gottesmanbacteria bacterium GW2011_GWB1_43_11]
MPAFNAEKTLEKTVKDFPPGLVSKTILVDDGSTDQTVKLAQKLGLTVFTHSANLGYGGNQKTCYWEALKENPDVVVMVHPDYQYDSSLTGEMVRPILEGRYDMMFGNRIRTRAEVLAGGMPRAKYYLNRVYCILENMVLGANFPEYFSGMRAYSGKLLKKIPFQRFSNDFVFDQQFMLVAYAHAFRIGTIDIPVRYFSEASSIQFVKGSKFLIETLVMLLRYLGFKWRLTQDDLFRIAS